MIIEKCTVEEEREFREICDWLRAHRLKMSCRDTARRKPKEVKILLVDKYTNRGIASA